MPGVGQSSAHLEAIQRKRHGFALFHDGNAGHLWRGEVSSLLGESILSVGVVIWLAFLTGSPVMVALGVLALGLPWLIFVPFAPMFEGASEPGRPLAWAGRLRILAALGVVGMHFLTIYPVLFGLLFVIGLMGRVRQALRVAATRVCLEPGEIELVSNDVFAGAALTSVLGPLLAAVLFLALDQRVILVALAAAALFLLSSNSDGFLDALPAERRAFSLATTTSASPDEAARADLLAAARARDSASDDDEEDDEAPLTPAQRERALPEWYQVGPGNPFQVIGDIRAGLGLAGGRAASATALLTLAALSLAGGGMCVLEAFYITDRLGLPVYYLGVLVALEAGGLALGALFAGSSRALKPGGAPALMGLMFSGAGLVALALAPIALVAYGAALLLGLANGVSVVVARNVLRAGHDGAERRALSAGEGFLSALASAVGVALFALFYEGSARASFGTHSLFPGLPVGLLIGGAGVGLILAGVILFITPGLRDRAAKPVADSMKPTVAKDISARMAALPGASGRFHKPEGGKKGKKRKKGGAAQTGAVGSLWDNHPDEDKGGYSSEYGAYQDEDDAEEYEEESSDYEDEDDWDRPPRGRGAPPRGGGRPPAGPHVGPRSRR
jgi:hypothetical protein